MIMEPMKMYFTRERLYGAVIANLRKKAALTGAEMVSDSFPVKQSTYSRMENGEVPIPISTLATIAEKLGTRPSILVGYCEQIEVRFIERGLLRYEHGVEVSPDVAIELEGKGLASMVLTML